MFVTGSSSIIPTVGRPTRRSGSRTGWPTTGSRSPWGWSATATTTPSWRIFFSTLKTELVYRNSWRTREDAENAMFGYIDGWYNTQCIQKKLGWRSPDEYEAIYHHRVPAGTR
ncbi:IS3 family transposase [Nocardia ignorata]|uniref:IS3 family transposase n=1 Tax=Nocardia ignorata TaxID=145285 RepID=UPI00353177A2